MEYQWVIDWVDDRIVNHPKLLVLLFLAATLVFTTGLGGIETESGQQQFVEDLPSFQALEDVQQDFDPSFSQINRTTTLVQDSANVLSKPALLRMLRSQKRLAEHEPLRVISTSSPAQTVARTLDPTATSLEDQIFAVEQATSSEIAAAVRTADARNPAFSTRLSDDFSTKSASANAMEATITHRAGRGKAAEAGGPGGGEVFPPNRDERVRTLIADSGPDIRVIGSPPDTINDTLVLVLPAALLFIILFLIVAYRDPTDLVLGLSAIAMTLIWTFGFIGIANIPFSVLMVAVPPLLIAIGIDFGIHAVNRYREERVRGHGINQSMRLTTNQVTVAFFIVMGTSAIGFLSNVVSAFPPTRDFGLAAAAGILFTFLIFGIYVPAAKVLLDRLREKYPIPIITETPLGSESSLLGRVLTGGAVIAQRAPYIFAIFIVLGTVGMGVYATGVQTGFSPDDFQPEEETPEFLQVLPEPFRPPAEFEFVKNDNFRDANFQEEGRILMYVEGRMRRDTALEDLRRAGRNPPPSFKREGRLAESQSIVTLIETQADRDPDFQRTVRRYDRSGNGIPDDDLPEVYDALGATSTGDQMSGFLSESRRSTLVIYTVDGDESDDVITADAREVASEFRADASPTGNSVIFDEALSLVLATVIETLIITLVGASVFLIVIYWVLEGEPTLGIANVIPIGITVVALVASMRAFGIKFNAINGTILAISIGLGIDYSVHIVHRFIDEYREKELRLAMRRTVVGTGGALTGSMLTTVFGVGALALALNPAVGVFGLLTALSVFYAYLGSIFLLPTVLVLWTKVRGDITAE